MWRSAIDQVVSTDKLLGRDDEAVRAEAPGLGVLAAVALVALLLAVVPAVVGVAILMGRTVALGIAFGFAASALVGFKALAMGWGFAAVLDRWEAPVAPVEVD